MDMSAGLSTPNSITPTTGFLLIDSDLRIKQSSATAAKMIGRNDESLLDSPIEDLIGPCPKLKALATGSRLLGSTTAIDWSLTIEGRMLLASAFTNDVPTDEAKRVIVLMLYDHPDAASDEKKPMHAPELAKAEGFLPSLRFGRSVSFIGLALMISTGLWFATTTGESRSVDNDDGSLGVISDADTPDPNAAEPSPSIEQDQSSRRFVGQVHPGTSVAGVAPLDGSISNLEAPDFGVFVQKGDLLITLDPDEEAANRQREARIAMIEAKAELVKLQNWSTSAEMRQAERGLRDADHEVKRAKLEGDRTKQLLDDGIIAASEHESALENLRSAESRKEEAVAQHEEAAAQATGEALDIAKERLEIAQASFEALEVAQQDREIRAPISGIMLPAPSTETTNSDLSVGQEVKKGASLFLIGEIDEVIVQTSVSEFDLELIKVGQEAGITSPSQADFKAMGEVVSISQISSSFGEPGMATGGGYTPPPSRYDVTVKVSGMDQEIKERIRIGMTVDVDIDTAADLVSSRSSAD